MKKGDGAICDSTVPLFYFFLYAVSNLVTRLSISGILKPFWFSGLAPWLAIPATSVAVASLRG
jgi:hypothetical protein